MFPISDRDHPRQGVPVVSVAIMAVCILVFLYQILLLDDFGLSSFYNNYGVLPYELTGRGDLGEQVTALLEQGDRTVLDVEGVSGTLARHALRIGNDGTVQFTDIRNVYDGGPGPWVTLFTSMFMHGGWMHLIGNMLFLWVFGNNLEARMGRVKFLAFYLIAGLFASAAQVAIDMDSAIPTIGASGAIAGVLGGYLVLFPHSRIQTVVFMILISVIAIPAWMLIGIWVIIQFFSGFISLGGEFSQGVAYWAHIGGFVAGFLILTGMAGVSRTRGLFGRS